MNFTFGICTTSGNKERVKNIISSIKRNNVPPSKCEIVVVGNVFLPGFTQYIVRVIPFDETKKSGWITKKKNIITERATFENIVYMHDYVVLEDGWYKTMCDYGGDWDLLMTRINNHDGTRYRDWALCGSWINNPFVEPNTTKALVPYEEKRLSRWQYFSGAYWIAKKEFMKANRLDETLGWGEGEDVEWSLRVKRKTNFLLNESTSVKIDKLGKASWMTDCDQEYLDKIYDSLTADGSPLPYQVDGVKREEYF